MLARAASVECCHAKKRTARRRDQRDDRGERSREGTSEAGSRPSFPTGSSPSCSPTSRGPASSSGPRRCASPGDASPARQLVSQGCSKNTTASRSSGPGTRSCWRSASRPEPSRSPLALHDRLSGDGDLRVRIGMDTGEVIREEKGYFADGVRASRDRPNSERRPGPRLRSDQGAAEGRPEARFADLGEKGGWTAGRPSSRVRGAASEPSA